MAGRKILFVGEFAAFRGGIERFMFANAAILRNEMGCTVDLCCLNQDSDDRNFTSGFDRSFHIAALDDQYDLAVVHKIRAAQDLKKLEQHAEKVAIFVHDHEYYCAARSYYLPDRRNCHQAFSPLRCALCGTLRRHPDLKRSFVSVPWLWRELKKQRHFLVISDFMRGNLVKNGIADECIHKIVPHIPTHEVRAVRAEPTILFFGQLIKGKGADLLLDALLLLKTPCKTVIMGSGEEENRLKQHPAAQIRHIEFIPWTNTPEQYLQAAQIVVLPARWQEPFGLTGAEAAGMGIPLVGFDSGGCGEYLIDGVTGRCVTPGDVAGLAEAVDELLLRPDRCRELGSNARALVKEKFSLRNTLESWKYLI